MNEYRKNMMENMLNNINDNGFRDNYGYIVDNYKGKAETLGEATLHTAIAVIALVTGNYNRDSDENDNEAINKNIKELLTTLLNSWGNIDNLGRIHPVRHLEKKEFNSEGIAFRASPLSKDSIGASIVAAYYAYSCPNSNEEVRLLARQLITKWSEYLILYQWRTHSNYIAGEFETNEPGGEFYKYIFDNAQHGGLTYKGIESYILLPHEIYALQNVAAKLGIPTSHWDIWSIGMTVELKQTIIDVVAPYIAELLGEGMTIIMNCLQISHEISIQLGSDDWNMGSIKHNFKIEIPQDLQGRIVDTAKIAVTDFIRESVRLDNYKVQAGDILGIIVNRVFDMLPEVLGPNSWRTILFGTIQWVNPWLSGSGWIEAATFLGTQLLLKTLKTSTISYTVWTFIAECETRPEMVDILNLTTMPDFLKFLKEQNNLNGIWAWLAKDSETVKNQLKLFESHKYDNAWSFAYGEDKFNDWIKKMEDSAKINENIGNKAPRLDYLVLDGLEEKGAPDGIFNVDRDMIKAFLRAWIEDKFKDIFQEAANQLADQIKNQFDEVGYFMKETISESGLIFQETWNTSMEYTQKYLRDGRIMSEKTWNKAKEMMHSLDVDLVNDQIMEQYWNRVTEKYWRQYTSKTGEIISRNITTWTDEMILESWNLAGSESKYLKEVISKDGRVIERVTHTLDGKKIEEFWNRSAVKYWKDVWDKVEGIDMHLIENVVINLDDTTVVKILSKAGELLGSTVFDPHGNIINKIGDIGSISLNDVLPHFKRYL